MPNISLVFTPYPVKLMVWVVQAGQQDMDRVADSSPETVGEEEESWKVEEGRDADVGPCRLCMQGEASTLRLFQDSSRAEQSLHAPMYLFLAMLAVADRGLPMSTMLWLRMLWLEAREISFGSCLAQMFFIHSFTDIESAVILAMAFDRYMAICHPLQYSYILTDSATTKICVAIVVRTALVQFPLPILLTRLCFTRVSKLSHPYCLHPDIIKHAGSDTRSNSTYGLFVLLSTLGLDLLFVLLSYLLILKTILNVATWREILRALNTCISHICAVLLFFIPMICLSMMHRFGKDISPQAYAFTANSHFLAPPILNPIVHSVKTKTTRRRILGVLCQRGVRTSRVAIYQ
ncbi:olfactory receptor 51L1-like [Ciconia boyciana]|uniref:olfactory receptor 51L1-like n=1 Tax=Ciconia boyciana TaxID=52775 RepID=UPI003B9E6A13